MGISWQQVGSLNAAQAVRLGLLAPAQQQVAATTTATTYTLNPLSGTTGTRALKLVDPDGVVYWLEYRTPSGQDSWLGTTANRFGLQSGVVLHRAAPFPTTSYYSDTSLLLDATPSLSGGWSSDVRVAFPVGTPVGVSGANFTVTVQSADATGASVRVSPLHGDRACLRRTTVPSSGVAVLESPDGVSVLGVGSDRAVWARPIQGSTTSWRSLGGSVLYGPTAVSAGSTDYVFAVGTNGVLFYRADSGTGWSAWTALGGYMTSSPASASLGDGHVRVFGRGGDGGLWTREAVGGVWSAWAPLGGFLSGQPAAAADLADGVVTVSVRGNDGQVYEQALAEGATSGTYVKRDLAVCSGLGAAATRDSAAPAQTAFLDSRASPLVLDGAGAVQPIGGGLTSTPAVESAGGGFLVAGRGGDNALWVYDGRPGGSGWLSLGGSLR